MLVAIRGNLIESCWERRPTSSACSMQLQPDPFPSNAPEPNDERAAPPAPIALMHGVPRHCQTCSTRAHCLPAALAGDQLRRFDGLITKRTRAGKGRVLYRGGDTFHSLHAIRYGSVKTTVLAEDGREQVTAYHVVGDIFGFDGISTGTHGTGATALEDTEVCALPFKGIEGLSLTLPVLQHKLHELMSEEIRREQAIMFMLGSMYADQRLALFLLNLADRYRRRGYSATEFTIHLTRAELGSYLGLKLETVSRAFSRLQGEGFLQVQGRTVKLLDTAALKRVIDWQKESGRDSPACEASGRGNQ